MLAAGVLGDIDVLRVGHHGSRTSTSSEFLTTTIPETGIISAGLGNQYGHPHQEVVDRLNAAGVNIVYTDVSDADDTLFLTSDCQDYSIAPLTGAIDVPSPTTTSEAAVTPTPEVTGGIRSPAIGEILINEVLANPNSGNEWVELYNASNSQLDLSGMWLDDIADGGSSLKQIPKSTSVLSGGYYVHVMGAAYLNDSGDDVRLLGADKKFEKKIDGFTYSSTQKGVSHCRNPDGGAWTGSCAPSRGTTN